MKEKAVVIWGVVISAIILSVIFDNVVVRFVSTIRTRLLDEIFLGLSNYATEIIIGIFVLISLFFLLKREKDKLTVLLWISVLISTIITFILKFLVERLRPYQMGLIEALPGVIKEAHYVWDFSFPSFQAMLPFVALLLISKKFPRLKYPWIVFSVLVAFSRIYLGAHFLSDVITGGALGFLIGMFFLNLEEKKKFLAKISEWFKRKFHLTQIPLF